MRFYEFERGKIVIDEQDITEVSRRSLRRHVAYVGQDVFLFRGTIRDNIEFGKPGASEDEIVAAAKGAYSSSSICRSGRCRKADCRKVSSGSVISS